MINDKRNNVALDAILESFRQIQLSFDETVASFRTSDKKQTGDAKEMSVREFFRCYFPISFRILDKEAPIFSQSGSSQKIDCLILHPNHPFLKTPQRDVVLAEGVFAAVEIKPDIANTNELLRALKQISSVKNLQRKVTQLNTHPIPTACQNIPCVIFAKKSPKNINDLFSKIMQHVFSTAYIESPPDVIMTMDNGLLINPGTIHDTILTPKIRQEIKDKQSPISFVHLKTEGHETLALLLLLMMDFYPPEPILADFILADYLRPLLANIEYDILEDKLLKPVHSE